MASSNRHWPSMFKSKPCNAHQHQWQHDINSSSLLSTSCHRTPYSSVPGCEERSPEPKPRWNPKPEQIRILEAIFNSGMVNPPRDEIRKIRTQLQEYGQVGDANVFYWFQNRKSRSKHKLRLLQNSSKQLNSQPPPPPPQQQTHHTHPPITTSITSLTALSSSSSSSEKSSPKSSKSPLPFSSQTVVDVLNSPTASVNQTSFQPHNDYMVEPFYFPVQSTTIEAGGGSGSFTQGFCFSDLSSLVHVQDNNNNTVGPCTSLLLSDITSFDSSKKDFHHDEKNMKMQISHNLPLPGTDNNTITVASSVNQSNQGLVESTCGAARSMVFINDVAFEVGVGPFNVREAFGDEFVLIHSSGHPVVVNDWGVTMHPLQHGASYYLVPFSMNEHI